MKFRHVESLIDDLWHWFDFCAQFSLDHVEVIAIIVSDEVDCKPEVSESARSANSVEVGF